MSNVIDMLKLPTLEQSYIVAGYDGIFNVVKRIDILETPFPEVEKFLEPYEFMFTSFWNSKDDKLNRINLVKSMIERKCAGIGIMPGPNLNDEIDQEIIELGNSCSFPVIYIPSDVRWSDIVSEFSLLTGSAVQSELDSNLVEILSVFSDLHTEKNVKKFCSQLSQFMSLPIVINADNVYYSGLEPNIVSTILAKVYSIKIKNSQKFNAPISMRIGNQNMAIVYYGKNSILATYIASQNITGFGLRMFHKIAPIIIKELDELSGGKPKKIYQNTAVNISEDASYYLVLLRKENISSATQYLGQKYLIYEENEFYNYIILLIQKNQKNENNIYEEYYRIIEKADPILFVFSSPCTSNKELFNQMKILKYTISSLLFLDGIFSIDELPLLYMLLYFPYEYKETVFKVSSTDINLDTEPSFFDTLRLYLVLKNIGNVAGLLGIHSNSVKYRISKCLKAFDNDTANALADLSSIKLLLLLEILKVEKTFI